MKANPPTVYGVTKIAQLFPSLRKIKNKSLREKVAAVWSEAITTGCGGGGGGVHEARPGKVSPVGGGNKNNFFGHTELLTPQLGWQHRVTQKNLRVPTSP